MRPSGVSCRTCAWWDKLSSRYEHMGQCRSHPVHVEPDEWCRHWEQKGRIEVEAGRLVVREVPVNEKPVSELYAEWAERVRREDERK